MNQIIKFIESCNNHEEEQYYENTHNSYANCLNYETIKSQLKNITLNRGDINVYSRDLKFLVKQSSQINAVRLTKWIGNFKIGRGVRYDDNYIYVEIPTNQTGDIIHNIKYKINDFKSKKNGNVFPIEIIKIANNDIINGDIILCTSSKTECKFVFKFDKHINMNYIIFYSYDYTILDKQIVEKFRKFGIVSKNWKSFDGKLANLDGNKYIKSNYGTLKYRCYIVGKEDEFSYYSCNSYYTSFLLPDNLVHEVKNIKIVPCKKTLNVSQSIKCRSVVIDRFDNIYQRTIPLFILGYFGVFIEIETYNVTSSDDYVDIIFDYKNYSDDELEIKKKMLIGSEIFPNLIVTPELIKDL